VKNILITVSPRPKESRLPPLGCRDSGFESDPGHAHSSAVFVLCPVQIEALRGVYRTSGNEQGKNEGGWRRRPPCGGEGRWEGELEDEKTMTSMSPLWRLSWLVRCVMFVHLVPSSKHGVITQDWKIYVKTAWKFCVLCKFHVTMLSMDL